MPTLNNCKNRLLDFVQTTIYPIVAAKQQNFFTNRGRYWHSGFTHSSPPNHTTIRYNDSIPDKLNDGPTDEQERWRNVFPLWETDPVPVSIQVGSYEGPEGHGWFIIAMFLFNGRSFQMVINTGPESYRTMEWTEIEPGP